MTNLAGGYGKGGSSKKWTREKQQRRNGWSDANAGGWEPHYSHQAHQVMSLAAQFRFFSRVLRRHAPEERVWAAEQQLQAGDHVVVQWECSEQHGVVCSTSGNRRGHDAPWVIYWSGDRLQSTPLPKFLHGGELYRMVYPLWACRCLSNFSSTMMPEILAEDYLESAEPEVTVKLASEAQRTWRPTWAFSADLEFCLFAKLGGRTPGWEIHNRKAFSEKQGLLPGHPVGCLMRAKPSELLTGAAGSPPVAAPCPSQSRQENPYPMHFTKDRWNPMPAQTLTQVPFSYMQAPQMSATAEAFVPSMQPWMPALHSAMHSRMPGPMQSGGASSAVDETVYQ